MKDPAPPDFKLLTKINLENYETSVDLRKFRRYVRET